MNQPLESTATFLAYARAAACLEMLGRRLQALPGSSEAAKVAFRHTGSLVTLHVASDDTQQIEGVNQALDAPLQLGAEVDKALAGSAATDPVLAAVVAEQMSTGRAALVFMCDYTLLSLHPDWLQAASERDPATGSFEVSAHPDGTTHMKIAGFPPQFLLEEDGPDASRPTFH